MSFCTATTLILWYFCFIGGNSSDEINFIKFLYFRSSRCHMKFNWSLVKLEESTEVLTTDTSFASKKTLFILVLYLLINLALIVTAVMAICEFDLLLFLMVKFTLCAIEKIGFVTISFQNNLKLTLMLIELCSLIVCLQPLSVKLQHVSLLHRWLDA